MYGADSRECSHGPGNETTHGFAINKVIKRSTPEKTGEFVILEFKRMSDVTDQYVTRAKRVATTQYVSIKSALEKTLGHQG